MTQQWLRQVSLRISDVTTGEGREIITPTTPEGDALHVQFNVRHATMEMPPTLGARIYNLSTGSQGSTQNTAAFLLGLGLTPVGLIGGASTIGANTNGQVVLRVGYPGNIGTIFTGNVKQCKAGRINATDTYVDVFASDGDLFRNWGVVNQTLAAGYSSYDVYNALVKATLAFGGQTGGLFDLPTTYSPQDVPVAPPAKALRGRAFFGMVRDHCRDLAVAYNGTWNTINGKLQFLSRTSFRSNIVTVLTSDSGLIGLPQQTQNGISVRALLNPQIGIGSVIRLDNQSIQRASANLATGAINQFPSINADGYYKVIYLDHTGDNRGQEWYTDMTCLSIDPSAIIPRSATVGLAPVSAKAVQDIATGIPQ